LQLFLRVTQRRGKSGADDTSVVPARAWSRNFS
jgi:hypothetical protein